MEIGKNKAITIRTFEPEDAAEFTAACLESIDTVGHWLAWCHEEYSCEEATAWIALCSEEIRPGIPTILEYSETRIHG